MFSDYWKRLVVANPRLEEGCNLTLTSESFRTQLERAYAAGRRDGYRQGQDEAPDDSLFGQIFGRTLKR